VYPAPAGASSQDMRVILFTFFRRNTSSVHNFRLPTTMAHSQPRGLPSAIGSIPDTHDVCAPSVDYATYLGSVSGSLDVLRLWPVLGQVMNVKRTGTPLPWGCTTARWPGCEASSWPACALPLPATLTALTRHRLPDRTTRSSARASGSSSSAVAAGWTMDDVRRWSSLDVAPPSPFRSDQPTAAPQACAVRWAK